MEIVKEQQTDGWHAARLGLVTASNAGAILGCDPYRNNEDVMRQMVRSFHKAKREFSGNVATEYGNFHEAGARIDYQLWSGNIVEPCGFFALESEPCWLGASPDGLIGVNGLLEIKCPYGMRESKGQFKALQEMPHYYAQIQIQLMVTCRDWCDFFQWCPSAHVVERVKRDNFWLLDNIPVLRAFWERYKEELGNPIHLEDKRKVIENEAASKLLREYDEVTDQLDFAQQRKKEIIDQLVMMAKDRDALVCGRKLTKVEREGSVSYAQVVKQFCPEVDLEPYRGKPSTSWRLS